MECIGFDASSLTSVQRDKLDAFVASQPEGDLLALRVYPNLDLTSDEHVGSGFMAIFRPDAPVDATILSHSLFQTLAVVEVPKRNGPEKLNDKFLESCALAVKGAVPQYAPVGRTLRPELRIAKGNRERDVWEAELGGPGSFVGSFAQVDAGDHRNKSYYLAARGTAPLLVEDMRRRISAAVSGPGGATYRSLVRDSPLANHMHYVANAAERNVARVLANVAEAYTLEIPRSNDVGAAVMHPDWAPAEVALPTWVQRSHAIREITHNGQPAVALYYGVVPADDCVQAKDARHFVVGSPYDGITSFRLKNMGDVLAAKALPADTGRKVAPDQLGSFVGWAPGVTGESPGGRLPTTTTGVESTSGRLNHDLHPDAFNPVPTSSFRTMGWDATQHVERLLPVSIKIWSDALKRQ